MKNSPFRADFSAMITLRRTPDRRVLVGIKYMAQNRCAHCACDNFHEGVLIAGNVQLGIQSVSGLAHEALVCDLCKQCGTISRVYVRNPDRNWIRV